MKILAIGAHFDDVELGCGGTLLKHHYSGDDVSILVVTESDYTSERAKHSRTKQDAFLEGWKTADILGAKLHMGNFKTLELTASKELINFLCKKVLEIAPDIVYTHFAGDQHLDHKAVAEASLIATRSVKTVLAYMSNIYNTIPVFTPCYFVDISDVFQKKLELVNCFESERKTHSHWERQLTYFNGLYGVKVGSEFAEPFEVIQIMN